MTKRMEDDPTALCGGRYRRSSGKSADRWGRTKGKIGFHGGSLEVERPRVRSRSGGEERKFHRLGVAHFPRSPFPA